MKDKCQLLSVINHGDKLDVSFLITTENYISYYKYKIDSSFKHNIEIKYKKKPFKAHNLCKAKGELIKKGRKENENN